MPSIIGAVVGGILGSVGIAGVLSRPRLLLVIIGAIVGAVVGYYVVGIFGIP